MKILQLGCGSMGTRRVRDLRERPDVALALYDQRADRRARARTRFGITAFETFDEALAWKPEILIISTPPGTKGPYVKLALERRMHHFVEADIWSYGVTDGALRRAGVLGAPSNTHIFQPLIKALPGLIRAELGTLLSYQSAGAADMTQWHPDEGDEYYGRHRDTAPARECIPFGLVFLNRIFGPAAAVAGCYGKYGKNSRIEDTWSLLMRLKNGGIGQLTTTLACRCAGNQNQDCAFGTEGVVRWDLSRGEIAIQTKADKHPRIQYFSPSGEVIEAVYREEINTFADFVLGRQQWPLSYDDYQYAIATLAAAERSDEESRWVAVEAGAEPETSLPRKK